MTHFMMRKALSSANLALPASILERLAHWLSRPRGILERNEEKEQQRVRNRSWQACAFRSALSKEALRQLRLLSAAAHAALTLARPSAA